MIEINGRYFACDECPIVWGLERQIELSENTEQNHSLSIADVIKQVRVNSMCVVFAMMPSSHIQKRRNLAEEKPVGHIEGEKQSRKMTDCEVLLRPVGINQ